MPIIYLRLYLQRAALSTSIFSSNRPNCIDRIGLSCFICREIGVLRKCAWQYHCARVAVLRHWSKQSGYFEWRYWTFREIWGGWSWPRSRNFYTAPPRTCCIRPNSLEQGARIIPSLFPIWPLNISGFPFYIKAIPCFLQSPYIIIHPILSPGIIENI